MVNSTPIVIRSLTGVFPQSFRDLTLVAGTIGDYAALVVPADSEIEDMAGCWPPMNDQGMDFAIGGGSVPGGMDHLVAAMVMQAAGEDPTAVNYIPYDAGGEAMAGLLSGEIDALSTGFSEAIALADAGEVRILGVTAPERVPAYDARRPSSSRASTPVRQLARLLRTAGDLGREARAEYVAALEACMKPTPGKRCARAMAGSTSGIPATISAPSWKRRSRRSAT
jgi:putative tricarboxylic transport membrane protein